MGNKYTVPLNVGAIRESCFRPADKWTPPTGDELRYLLENVLNLSQEGLARHVGVNGRTVRRFKSAVSAAEAVDGLAAGIYIVNGKKILVR